MRITVLYTIWDRVYGTILSAFSFLFKKRNPFIIIYDFRYYWNYNTRAPCVVKCEMIRQVAAVFPSHFDSILENVEVSKIERKKKHGESNFPQHWETIIIYRDGVPRTF